jgi:hypothetical protein
MRALMWTSKLGSQESLVWDFIVLMCLPREKISIPEEARKDRKGGIDTTLQKRNE